MVLEIMRNLYYGRKISNDFQFCITSESYETHGDLIAAVLSLAGLLPSCVCERISGISLSLCSCESALYFLVSCHYFSDITSKLLPL